MKSNYLIPCWYHIHLTQFFFVYHISSISKFVLRLNLDIILTGDSFKLVILKANYSTLLFNSGYMCWKTYEVSVSFCHLLNASWCSMISKNSFAQSLRSQLNSLQEASGGKRISLNDLVIKVYFITFCIDALTILLGKMTGDHIPEILH